MDTLYISDLDGTLLDGNAKLSDYTKNELNRLIANGVNFSFATARTAATAIKMFDGVNINLPVVLMNGVCIYDIKDKCYIKTELMPSAAKSRLIDIINEHKLSGFLYSINGSELDVYYYNLDTPNAKAFVAERERLYGKVFTHVNNFTECINIDIVYYSVSDIKEKLDGIYEELKTDKSVHAEYYRDVYDTKCWYLEVFANTASKFNAVEYLREKYEIEYIVGFGDNLNDIPLFKASDECYAVFNAKDEVKDFASGVILSNTDDGVVKKIAELSRK